MAMKMNVNGKRKRMRPQKKNGRIWLRVNKITIGVCKDVIGCYGKSCWGEVQNKGDILQIIKSVNEGGEELKCK